MKVVCTADTHGMHKHLEVPDGDIFIFTGDMTDAGNNQSLLDFNEFLGALPHRYKIVIDGNHDLAPEKIREFITNATYLRHNLLEIENLKIWGTSWSYWLNNQIELIKKQQDLSLFWQTIPANIDILITHFPPYQIGDLTNSGKHLGNKDLLEALRRIKPRYHVFGHVHEAYGVYENKIEDFDITHINASAIKGFGTELKPPIVFTIYS